MNLWTIKQGIVKALSFTIDLAHYILKKKYSKQVFQLARCVC